MRPFALAVFFLFHLFIGNAQFSKDQVKEDINYLYTQLDTYHPGFYRYTSKADMKGAFYKACGRGPLDELKLYVQVNALISKIGCGHTRTRMSDRLKNNIESSLVFLPFTVKILGNQVFVRNSLDSRLQPGDEILSINDVTIDAILKMMYSFMPADGYIESGKARRTEMRFSEYYQLFIDADARMYEVERVGKDMMESRLNVAGINLNQVRGLNESKDDELLSIRYAKNYAYLSIKTFGSQSLYRAGFDYESFLAESFKELREKQVPNLILDLRGNGGGRDNYGALLVSYLAKDSFGYFDNIQVTKNYPGRSWKAGDSFFMTDHQGLNVWQPNQNRFSGDVFVLIDGLSFSTCADVATVLHHHQWATFIGDETGGGYDGNTSGHSRSITLPNSGIQVNVPMWMYTTANVGHTYHGRGVIPDFPITLTWDEYASNSDKVLEKAISLIEKSQD